MTSRTTVHRRSLVEEKTDICDGSTFKLSPESLSGFGFALVLDNLFARLAPRRDLQQLRELLFGKRLVKELQFDGVALDAVDVLHLVGLQRGLGIDFRDRACNEILRAAHLG